MNFGLVVLQTLGISAAMVVALFYFGYGATRFLLPQSFPERGPFDEFRVLLTPFAGMALIIVFDYLALFFNLNLTTATFVLLAIATIINGAAVFGGQPRGMGRTARSALTRTHVILIGAAVITLCTAVAPLWRYGYVTIIGENWDYEFYLPLADLLRAMPTAALTQAPANPLLNIILSRHILPLPMGFSYLQSTLDILWRQNALDTYAILLAVLHALGSISAFVFFRATLKMARRAALIASTLLAFNGLLLWVTYWGFGLHLASLALLPLAIAFGVDALLRRAPENLERGEPTGSSLRSAVPLAALFLAALNVTFHPSLIAALLPLGVIGLYTLVSRPHRIRTFAMGIALIVLTLIFSFPTLFHIQDFGREYYGRTPLAIGLREFVPLSDAYGLSLHTLELAVGHTIPTPAVFDLATRVWNTLGAVLLVVVLAVSLFALWQLRRDRERRAVGYLIIGAFVFYVAVFRLPFLRPYPYGFLKSLTLAAFLLSALTAEGLEQLANLKVGTLVGLNAPALKLSNLLTGIVAALTLFTFGVSLEQYFKPAPPFFNADDLLIRNAEKFLPGGARVFLTDRPQAQKIPMGLAAYALLDRELRGRVETGYGELKNVEPGVVYDYALLARGEDPATRGYQTQALWRNQRFALYPRVAGVSYHLNQNARIVAPKALTWTIGAQGPISSTQTLTPTAGMRAVSIALGSFVPQTVTVALGHLQQMLQLPAGLTVYNFPQTPLPAALSITSSVSPDLMNAALTTGPHQLPDADISLFVPWVELRVGDSTNVQTTNALLVRCLSATAQGLSARCFVANPANKELRWEWVVRGKPNGAREEQELIRRTANASPQKSVDIAASAAIGLDSLQFDNAAPRKFDPQKIPDGDYRGSLEIFDGDILVAQIELYNFTISRGGQSLTPQSPTDSPLVIIAP